MQKIDAGEVGEAGVKMEKHFKIRRSAVLLDEKQLAGMKSRINVSKRTLLSSPVTSVCMCPRHSINGIETRGGEKY